jgi:hypothetical protein
MGNGSHPKNTQRIGRIGPLGMMTISDGDLLLVGIQVRMKGSNHVDSGLYRTADFDLAQEVVRKALRRDGMVGRVAPGQLIKETLIKAEARYPTILRHLFHGLGKRFW